MTKTKTATDDLDQAIEYLVEHPNVIRSAFLHPETHRRSGGPLFDDLIGGGRAGSGGCLLLARVGLANSTFGDEIDSAIREDVALPDNFERFEIEFQAALPSKRRKMLRPLAAWHRRLRKIRDARVKK